MLVFGGVSGEKTPWIDGRRFFSQVTVFSAFAASPEALLPTALPTWLGGSAVGTSSH